MTAPMPREELPATELKYLEDNIATVAWHLGRPGASIAVSYDNGVRLIVDAGAVLNEISRRLDPGPAQAVPSGWKLVPDRPTQRQMDAGLYQSSADSTWADVYSIYADMMDAAPSIDDHPDVVKSVAAPPSNQGASK